MGNDKGKVTRRRQISPSRRDRRKRSSWVRPSLAWSSVSEEEPADRRGLSSCSIQKRRQKLA
jgi:hypothetical protein